MGSIEEGVWAVIAGRSGGSEAEAEAQRRWQEGHCRRHQETLGQGESRSGHGGQGPADARRQENRSEESAGEGLTEDREEGCRQATAESRRDSCCSGGDGDRVALPSRRDASLAQLGCDRSRVKI